MRLPQSKAGKILLGIGLVFVAIIILFGYLFFQGVKESPQAEAEVSMFLQKVSDGNIDDAYSQTSEVFKKDVSREDLEELATYGEAQYNDFESLDQTGFFISKTPDGTIYNYNGEITYEDGDKGTVEARLIKENNKFKLFYIYVTVSPDRLKKFEQENQPVLGAQSED